jgi:hypothetical protein
LTGYGHLSEAATEEMAVAMVKTAAIMAETTAEADITNGKGDSGNDKDSGNEDSGNEDSGNEDSGNEDSGNGKNGKDGGSGC